MITYTAIHNGLPAIYSKASRGTGEARLMSGASAGELDPDWSRDGKFLIYVARSSQQTSKLFYREMRQHGASDGPTAFAKSTFNQGAPRFSSDGRRIAYVSDESGANEVYIRDFPSGANPRRISAHGGTAPRWRRDGNEIFYVETPSLMAVSVTARPIFSTGAPKPLFQKPSLRSLVPEFDVSADGTRFVILDRPAVQEPLAIHVVHNWFEEFHGQQKPR